MEMYGRKQKRSCECSIVNSKYMGGGRKNGPRGIESLALRPVEVSDTMSGTSVGHAVETVVHGKKNEKTEKGLQSDRQCHA